MSAARGTAITRRVARAIARCELTFVDRTAIDVDRARQQHQDYCQRLAVAGYHVVTLDEDEDFPDGCFVEDTAVVVGDTAVVAMPGAVSRRGETEAVKVELGRHRTLHSIALPATLDGGDVLVIGQRLFVGRSTRTNDAGIAALAAIAGPQGFSVVAVDVARRLHLKTVVTALDDHTVLVNRRGLTAAAFNDDVFGAFRVIDVDDDEAAAANVLRVGDEVWMSAGHPATAKKVAAGGFTVVTVDISELQRAEAGLTCLSILLPALAPPAPPAPPRF